MVVVGGGWGGGKSEEEIVRRAVQDVSKAPYLEEYSGDGDYEVVTTLEIPNSQLMRVVVKNVGKPGRILVVLGTEVIHPGTRVKVMSVDYMESPYLGTAILALVKKK